MIKLPQNHARLLRLGLIAICALAALAAGGVARWRCVERFGVRDRALLGTDGYYYYVSTAEYLLRGQGFKSAYNEERTPKPPYSIFPPLQPAFIATVFAGTGSRELINIYRTQALLGVVAGVVVFALLYPWAGALAALFGLWIWALYPEFVYWARLPMSECNYFVLMILMLWGLAWWAKKPTWRRAALAAGLIGLGNLQRPLAMVLGLACVPLVWLLVREKKQRWLQSAVFATLPYAMLLPWMLYNLHRTGEPVWVSSSGGILVYASNHPGYDPIKNPEYLKTPTANWQLPEIENKFWSKEMEGHRTQFWLSKQYTREFKQYAIHHPLHFLKNFGIKFVQRFILFPDVLNTVAMAYHPWLRPWKFAIIFYGLLGLGVMGLFTRWRGALDPTRLTLTWSFAYYAFFAALFPWDNDGRYSLPLQIFLMFFAAVSLSRLVRLTVWLLKPVFYFLFVMPFVASGPSQEAE